MYSGHVLASSHPSKHQHERTTPAVAAPPIIVEISQRHLLVLPPRKHSHLHTARFAEAIVCLHGMRTSELMVQLTTGDISQAMLRSDVRQHLSVDAATVTFSRRLSTGYRLLIVYLSWPRRRYPERRARLYNPLHISCASLRSNVAQRLWPPMTYSQPLKTHCRSG